MDPAATGNAAAQTFNAPRSSGGAVAGSARSRVIRNFSAYPLHRTKTLLLTGGGNAAGRFGVDSSQMSRGRGRGDLHGYGASRTAQCACEFLAQVAQN